MFHKNNLKGKAFAAIFTNCSRAILLQRRFAKFCVSLLGQEVRIFLDCATCLQAPCEASIVEANRVCSSPACVRQAQKEHQLDARLALPLQQPTLPTYQDTTCLTIRTCSCATTRPGLQTFLASTHRKCSEAQHPSSSAAGALEAVHCHLQTYRSTSMCCQQ